MDMAPNADLVVTQVAAILQLQTDAEKAAIRSIFHQLSLSQRETILEYFVPEYQKNQSATGIPELLRNLFMYPEVDLDLKYRYVVHIGLPFIALVVSHNENQTLSFSTVAKTAEQNPWKLCTAAIQITPAGDVLVS
jgi:hypothetical protein